MVRNSAMRHCLVIKNIDKIQRQRNKIFHMITATPWYVKNSFIYVDLSVPLAKTDHASYTNAYSNKLEDHLNLLACDILYFSAHNWLKTKDTFALCRMQNITCIGLILVYDLLAASINSVAFAALFAITLTHHSVNMCPIIFSYALLSNLFPLIVY